MNKENRQKLKDILEDYVRDMQSTEYVIDKILKLVEEDEGSL